jgi:hypothetical protein
MKATKIQLAGIKRRKKVNNKKYGWGGLSESRGHGFGRMSFTPGQVNNNANSGKLEFKPENELIRKSSGVFVAAYTQEEIDEYYKQEAINKRFSEDGYIIGDDVPKYNYPGQNAKSESLHNKALGENITTKDENHTD